MMLTITTVSLARAPREDNMMTTITTVSLVRDPRIIMMTTTIPREARVDTMMMDMVAREVKLGQLSIPDYAQCNPDTPNRCCEGLARTLAAYDGTFLCGEPHVTANSVLSPEFL